MGSLLVSSARQRKYMSPSASAMMYEWSGRDRLKQVSLAERGNGYNILRIETTTPLQCRLSLGRDSGLQVQIRTNGGQGLKFGKSASA